MLLVYSDPNTIKMLLVLASASYESLVNESQPRLQFNAFVQARGFLLNDSFVATFYEKLVDLKDSDFIQIDRSMLQLFGYSNNMLVVKKGDASEMDEDLNPKYIDKRNDFSSALRALRKMSAFREGISLDDLNADYVLVSDILSRGGKKKNIYVKKRLLEHLCIMSHSPNGHLIREYFLNLHRAITEYVDYQRDYQNMVTMKFKVDKIDLLSKIDK